jgi:hypothetical protein
MHPEDGSCHVSHETIYRRRAAKSLADYGRPPNATLN